VILYVALLSMATKQLTFQKKGMFQFYALATLEMNFIFEKI